MSLFILEYLHFVAAILAVLVSISASALFFITYRSEKAMQTVWRAVGFGALALSFILLILERKFPIVGLAAIVVELIGFAAIAQGVFAEPKLSKLREVKSTGKKTVEKITIRESIMSAAPVIIGLIAIVVLVMGGIYFVSSTTPFLEATFAALSIVFILATMRVQIKRYRTEGADKATKLQNLWPLAAYGFLLVRAVLVVLNRVPEDIDIVAFRQLTLDYSITWQLAVILTLVAFFFLAIWAWNFIKVRFFLRTYVTFLGIAILVSSLGSLVFTVLIFSIVQNNNLQLMQRGAQTQKIVLDDRSNTALFFARTVASDLSIVENFVDGNYREVQNETSLYLEQSGVDILRIYNAAGEVVASPSDRRDVGRSFAEDKLVAFAITDNRQIKSFATEPGVLSDTLVARSIHPVADAKDNVIGAVEVGYRFDNAFVDFSKERSGLDVTMFSGKKRSATTIKTLNNVSRWVGSEETTGDVLNRVLEQGQPLATQTDRLGIINYSGFEPLKDIDGEIIGMIAVETPTVILFEDTRQQLISTFLIATVVSLVAALLGFLAIQNFNTSQEKATAKTRSKAKK